MMFVSRGMELAYISKTISHLDFEYIKKRYKDKKK